MLNDKQWIIYEHVKDYINKDTDYMILTDVSGTDKIFLLNALLSYTSDIIYIALVSSYVEIIA